MLMPMACAADHARIHALCALTIAYKSALINALCVPMAITDDPARMHVPTQAPQPPLMHPHMLGAMLHFKAAPPIRLLREGGIQAEVAAPACSHPHWHSHQQEWGSRQGRGRWRDMLARLGHQVRSVCCSGIFGGVFWQHRIGCRRPGSQDKQFLQVVCQC